MNALALLAQLKLPGGLGIAVIVTAALVLIVVVGQTDKMVIINSGNAVMAGYYGDPEGTAQAIRGGWFHSGDAAIVHPDGFLEIRDRLKDVIISGGENISSVEVEGLLLRHPAVQEVAVVGVPHEKWGEAPHAFVVLKADAAATDTELREFARDRLAHFKVPQGFTFAAELPETATGKIQKYILRSGRPNIARQQAVAPKGSRGNSCSIRGPF